MMTNIKFKLIFKTLIMSFSLLSVISCIKGDDDKEYELKVGEYLPVFSVTMNDMTEVTSSYLSEGIALVMFFHTDCPDCQGTLPSVQRIYDEFLPEGMKFALISRSQLDGPIKAYWESQGYTMPYSAQPDRKIYSLFASSRVPRVYICKDGCVMSCYHDDPIPTYEQLLSDVEALF